MIFLKPPRDLPSAASPCQETRNHVRDSILLLAKAQIKHANTGDLFAVPVTVAAHVQGGHAVAAYTAIRHKSPADVKPTRTVLLAHPPAPMKTTEVAPPPVKPQSRLEELKQISASIDRELAELGKMSAKIAMSGTLAEGAAHDARLDRLEAQRAKVRAEMKQLEPLPEKERVFQSDIDNAAAAARWKVMQERQIAGLTAKPKSKPIPIIKRPAA